VQAAASDPGEQVASGAPGELLTEQAAIEVLFRCDSQTSRTRSGLAS